MLYNIIMLYNESYMPMLSSPGKGIRGKPSPERRSGIFINPIYIYIYIYIYIL